MNRNRRYLTAVSLLAVAGLACSSDVTNPFAPMGLELQFSPSVDTLFLSDSAVSTPVHLTLTATSFGQSIPVPRGVEWTVSDPSVAVIVDTTGGVLPVGLGTTTVTARINSTKAQGTIVVVQKVQSVLVTPNPVTGFVGDSANIVASALDANGAFVAGTAYSFTVTDPTKVALTRTGTRTATAVFLKAGTARIDVTADGHVGSATVTIQSP